MAGKYDPKANAASTIIFNKARFTLLTDRFVRFEWAEDGKFEDSPTFKVANRLMPAVKHKVLRNGRNLTITTGRLELRCRDNGRPFNSGNMEARFTMDGRTRTWKPGMKDPANLLGTQRTLDGYDGGRAYNWQTRKLHATRIPDGFISRSGWSVVDDSSGIVLKTLPGGRRWVTRRPEGKRQDLYLMAYGLDFKECIGDAAKVFGRQPLPPRYALGYWWSRYWAYSDKELEELINNFNAMNCPIDVLVIDMDWHLEGWTGYTWDKRYFPDHREFLAWCKAQKLKVTLNLHPAQGVQKHEEQFAAMCRAMKLNPKKVKSVPFDCTDPRYMDAYFKLLHHPHENAGVDFWWMDWQQGHGSKMEGLDPLPWLNQLHWEDQEKRNRAKRPLVFSRFGGVGSGRYPVGFSGDTFRTWQSLQHQPYFTATAANVLYGYWSHDIGGHMGGKPTSEMYMRWVQFGAFSPVLRTHASKDSSVDRRFWSHGDPYGSIMMDYVRRRYEMVPYIYTENRKAYDSGISLCRPMYHEWPKEKPAYNARYQYMFGDKMLVAPVTAPIESADETVAVKIWLPKGKWFDTAIGDIVQGGRTITRRYTISEIPVFVRPGVVIPGQGCVRRLEPGSYANLVMTVYPGDSGSYSLYEDDGYSQEYTTGRFATIKMSHRTQGRRKIITIGRAEGSYKGFQALRQFELRLPSSVPPASVKVGGRKFKWSYRPRKDRWTYDGRTATTVISISSLNLAKGLSIEIASQRGMKSASAMGLKGIMTRMERINHYINMALSLHVMHPRERLATDLLQTANRISRNPAMFNEQRRLLKLGIRDLPAVMAGLKRNIRNQKKSKWLREKIPWVEKVRTMAENLRSM